MKYMGGIPVDRSKPGGLIKDLLRQVEDKKKRTYWSCTRRDKVKGGRVENRILKNC
ncbi:MAG: hypothetical protein Ct9H90mP6_08380 [Gammaproteobacteria bacterium]|nr:MAG: hypothetical protein Ct9H90mP6_08380 [Gammaproteobacteria bacterium]